MAKYSSQASNLRGDPYIVFDGVLFRNHNPELSLTGYKRVLFNIYSQVRGHYLDGDHKNEIATLWDEFQTIHRKYSKIEGIDYASSMVTDCELELMTFQLNLDRLINRLEILKEAGVGDIGFIEY